jgi:hypothetical protein
MDKYSSLFSLFVFKEEKSYMALTLVVNIIFIKLLQTLRLNKLNICPSQAFIAKSNLFELSELYTVEYLSYAPDLKCRS